MSFILGKDCKLYYKVDGQAGGGSYVELTNCIDLKNPLTADTADVTTRGNNGWKAKVATLKDGTVSWDMIYDTADAGFIAIKNAYLNNGIIAFRIWTRTDGGGLTADFMITKFERDESLTEAVKVSVEATPTYSASPPVWTN